MSATTEVPRTSLTINEAAESVGISDKVIREAIATGDLIARYVTKTKPVILLEDLRAWVAAAPTAARR